MSFIKLLLQPNCYLPQSAGIQDILVAGEKIAGMRPPGGFDAIKSMAETFDCTGLNAFPGIVDQHVHIIGGGGEGGPVSRIDEIAFEEILLAGVTTVVGVLGFDSFTKSLRSLLAKANSFEALGITAFIYTGSYAIPTVTITGSIESDLVLIDKVIGTGEVALSDSRSSQPRYDELAKLCAKTYISGRLSGKAGVVHMHVGDGKEKIGPLKKLLTDSDLPKDMFVPTHMNRNPALMDEAVSFCREGGNIDFTAGEMKGVGVPDAVSRLISSGLELSRVTVSSDANGSSGSDVTKIGSLYRDITDTIRRKNIPPETAFSLVTENPAKILKLYPGKGTLLEGSDADIILTDREYAVQKLFCKGRQFIENGRVINGGAS
jgi:beta-aspartyl-dipeptidase (metallo-type)